jgi:hypothetical protein
MGRILAALRTGLARKHSAAAGVGGGALPPLIVVMGDHGMADGGGHGGASDPEVMVPLVLISDALKVNTSMPPITLNYVPSGRFLIPYSVPYRAGLSGWIPFFENIYLSRFML